MGACCSSMCPTQLAEPAPAASKPADNANQSQPDAQPTIKSPGELGKPLSNRHSFASSESKRRSIPAEDINPQSTVESVFKAHAGGSDVMLLEDVAAFFTALEFPVEQGEGLVACYLFQAESFEQLTMNEVLQYCRAHSAPTLQALKASMNTEAASTFRASRSIRQCFSYVFAVSKKAFPETKTLERQVSLELLRMLLFENRFFAPGQVAKQLYDFLQQSPKALTKDDWLSISEFVFTYRDRLDGYQLDDAWPTLLDDFVRSLSRE